MIALLLSLAFGQSTVVLRVEVVPACLTDAADPPSCVLLAPAPGVVCERVGDGCVLVETPPEPEPTEEAEP